MEQVAEQTAKVESPSSQMPTIEVVQIFKTRSGNQDGMNVQLRWTTERKRPQASNLTSKFLGKKIALPQTPEKRVALQFFGNDVIEEFGIEVGKNFNELWTAKGEAPVRLTIKEIDAATFEAMTESQRIGYQAKINPTSGEYLTYEGGHIYRKVEITELDVQDVYLQSDNSELVQAPVESLEDTHSV